MVRQAEPSACDAWRARRYGCLPSATGPAQPPDSAAQATRRLLDQRLPDGCALKAGGEPENLPVESSYDDGLIAACNDLGQCARVRT